MTEKEVVEDAKERAVDNDEEEEEEDIEQEAEGDHGDTEEGAEANETSLNSKQKKKKKSKAAAKLRKKLGLSSKGDGEDDSRSAKEIRSASILSDEEVTQLQRVIEKEQGPKAASKADRATLEKLMKMMNLEKTALLKDQEAKQKQYKSIADHKFWKTQPVTKPGE